MFHTPHGRVTALVGSVTQVSHGDVDRVVVHIHHGDMEGGSTGFTGVNRKFRGPASLHSLRLDTRSKNLNTNINCEIDLLIDWFIYWFINCLLDCLVDWLIAWLVEFFPLFHGRKFTLTLSGLTPSGMLVICAIKGDPGMSSSLHSTCTAYSPGAVGQYLTSAVWSPLSLQSILAWLGPSIEKPDWKKAKREKRFNLAFYGHWCKGAYLMEPFRRSSPHWNRPSGPPRRPPSPARKRGPWRWCTFPHSPRTGTLALLGRRTTRSPCTGRESWESTWTRSWCCQSSSTRIAPPLPKNKKMRFIGRFTETRDFQEKNLPFYSRPHKFCPLNFEKMKNEYFQSQFLKKDIFIMTLHFITLKN